MLANPRIGQEVLIHYRQDARSLLPYHGRRGRVVIRSTGKPRNHCIDIDGIRVVVPCGNLQKLH
jgi:hypothetical protein